MARYIVLIDWTDQGVRNATDSVNRSRQAKDIFQPMGVNIEAIYWTVGNHDIVAILTAPDGESIAAAVVKLAGAGNVRTKTLQAFDEAEFEAILGRLG